MALEELNIVVEHWKCDHCRRHSQCWNLNLIYTFKYRNFTHKIFAFTTMEANATRRAKSASASSSLSNDTFLWLILLYQATNFLRAICCSNIVLLFALTSAALLRVPSSFSSYQKKEEKRVNKNTISSSFYRHRFHFLLQQNPHPQGDLVKKVKQHTKNRTAIKRSAFALCWIPSGEDVFCWQWMTDKRQVFFTLVSSTLKRLRIISN